MNEVAQSLSSEYHQFSKIYHETDFLCGHESEILRQVLKKMPKDAIQLTSRQLAKKNRSKCFKNNYDNADYVPETRKRKRSEAIGGQKIHNAKKQPQINSMTRQTHSDMAWRCLVCKSTHSNKLMVRRHLKKFHSELYACSENWQQLAANDITYSESLKCHLCAESGIDAQFANHIALGLHRKKHHGETFGRPTSYQHDMLADNCKQNTSTKSRLVNQVDAMLNHQSAQYQQQQPQLQYLYDDGHNTVGFAQFKKLLQQLYQNNDILAQANDCLNGLKR